jgi:hypothetical protein
MNKEQLLRFANTLSDEEQILIWSWTKFDLDYDQEDNGQPKLTDEQWEKFQFWMNKYVDLDQDYSDALHYALGKE